MLLLLALACADPAAPRAAAPDGGQDSAAPAPPLSAETVQAGLVDSLAVLTGSAPLRMHDTYYGSVLRGGDPSCPWRSNAYAGQDYWEDDCDAGDGSRWFGWALSSRARDVRVFSEQRIYRDVGWYYGNARVLTPAGWVFEGWGSAELRSWEAEDGQSSGFYAAMAGTFTWTGENPGWLGDLHNHGWALDGYLDAAGRVLTAQGGLSMLNGEIDAFAFDGLRFDEPATGCLAEPAGTVRLHHGDLQRWYGVHFDPTVSCDGCGEITLQGEVIGQACMDWSFFVDWAVQPWEAR